MMLNMELGEGLYCSRERSDVRLNFCGRVTLVKTRTTLPLGKAWGQNLYVDGSEVLSGEADYMMPAWGVRRTTKPDEVNMRFQKVELQVKLDFPPCPWLVDVALWQLVPLDGNLHGEFMNIKILS